MESIEIKDVYSPDLTLFISRTECLHEGRPCLLMNWPDADEPLFITCEEIKKLKGFLEAYLRDGEYEGGANDGT